MASGKTAMKLVREWVVFTDPVRAGWEWHLDVTFLLSNWGCIYGRGCKGIDGVPVHGCCSYGVWFRDDADKKKTARMAKMLTADEWQNYDKRSSGVLAHGGKTSPGRTKLSGGACIFLNRADFPTGAGCALHHAAMRRGEQPADWKPTLCWQIPINFDEQEDEERYLVTSFDHTDWGEDGVTEPLTWWCIGDAEAVTTTMVYRSMEAELRKLMGDVVYDTARAYLDERAAARGRARTPVGSGSA